jgi:hypothetical protein
MTFAGEEPLKETMKLSFETDSLAKEKANFPPLFVSHKQFLHHVKGTLKTTFVNLFRVFLPLAVSAQPTPPARQRYIESYFC